MTPFSRWARESSMKTNPLPAAEKKPPKLRWFQYSLRSLFLLTLLVAIGMSWLTVTMQSQRKQKAAAEAIEAAGGTVEYEQTWVGKLLRDDSLVRVTVVKPRYEDDPFTSPAELPTDVVLEHLQELSQLQELHLADTKITDAGLEHLQVLSQLQVLMLDNTQDQRRRAGASARVGPTSYSVAPQHPSHRCWTGASPRNDPTPAAGYLQHQSHRCRTGASTGIESTRLACDPRHPSHRCRVASSPTIEPTTVAVARQHASHQRRREEAPAGIAKLPN